MECERRGGDRSGSPSRPPPPWAKSPAVVTAPGDLARGGCGRLGKPPACLLPLLSHLVFRQRNRVGRGGRLGASPAGHLPHLQCQVMTPAISPEGKWLAGQAPSLSLPLLSHSVFRQSERRGMRQAGAFPADRLPLGARSPAVVDAPIKRRRFGVR
ncbi:hypothetical protein CRG98_035227 [Punica granatum]|uniref:Uncharacterized protein n=1 Tax=Punica granatum TaxID=22663 RepID=A0A2I0IM26_PUNGR|nr:hypothetical protein CRG98_035227 [Punica granatum]